MQKPTTTLFTIPVLALALGMLYAPTVLSASPFLQDDPFGDPFGGGDNKQDPMSDPFGGAGDPFGAGAQPAANTNPGTQPSNAKMPKVDSAVVLAIRETNPSTPEELIKALQIMVDTRNYEEAKSYLTKLDSAGLDEATSFQLVEKIGSDFLFRLIRSEPMAPEGSTFGRKVMDSARKHNANPATLQSYFNDMASESASKRLSARRGFQLSGLPGLTFLVSKAPSASQDLQQQYAVAAAGIGRRVVRPMQAVIETGTPDQRAFAISVIGMTQSKKSIPFLLAPLFAEGINENVRQAAATSFKRILGGAPKLEESKKFLQAQINRINDGARPMDLDSGTETTLWAWDPSGKFLSRQVSPDLARVLSLEAYGKALYEIDTSDLQSEVIYLATQLNAIKALGAESVVDAVGSRNLSEVQSRKWVVVLDYCLKNKLLDGAVAAAEIIGSTGDGSLLYVSDFSPLVRAMEYGDRQLRFACTKAIIDLKPKRSFPGANKVLDSLVYFAGSRGQRRAIVAHPKFSEGQNLIGSLSKLGISAVATTTGRELYRRAAEDSDVELILISDAIDKPALGETLLQLRSNPAMKNIPIGILSQKHRQLRNEQIAAVDPKTISLKQPYRISFTVDQILPAENAEINNAIISWTVYSDILEQALKQNNRTVALQMLMTMQHGYNDNLSSLAVDNSVVVAAMRNSDTQIRSLASKLFLRMSGRKPIYEKPKETGTVSGRILVVHPTSNDIRPMLDELEEMGFTVSVVGTADAALQVIPSLTRLRFVIGSTEFGGLVEAEIRKALGKKFRLNPIPTTFIDRADSYREAPIARPIFELQIEQLVGMNGGRQISRNERIEQARTCLGFVGDIISNRDQFSFFDPIRHEKRLTGTLANSDLAASAIPVLGGLATPQAQKALLDFASDSFQKMEFRKLAADAFQQAVKKRGLMLTKAELLEQYDRYNASANASEETQKVLGQILDTIEKK